MKMVRIGLLSLTVILVGGLSAGATLDFLGEQIRKGADLARETVVKGSEALSTDISRGVEVVRKGAEEAGKTVSSAAESVRDTAAEGIETVGRVVHEGAQTVQKNIEKGTEVAGKIVQEGTKKVYETAKPVLDAAGNVIAESKKTIHQGAEALGRGTQQAIDFATRVTRPFTDAAVATSNAFKDAVSKALSSGVKTVQSGVEFVGEQVTVGGKVVIKTTGQSIQFVGDQLKKVGVLIEEGAEVSPIILEKIWDRTQFLINKAVQEGLRRAKEAPKLATGAAAVFITNKLPNALMVKTDSGEIVELSPKEEIFAGAQMRVVFVPAQSAYVVYGDKGKELCTLHTGFNGDLLWVKVTSPDMSENIRAYVGGHNGSVIYRVNEKLKVRVSWYLNTSKYFLHDFFFELLPA